MITLTLPWPSSALSPNSRKRWDKIEAVTNARNEAAYITRTEYYGDMPQPAGVRLVVTFHKPTARRMDLDNLVGRVKPLQDGVFQALGWDDRIICEATYIMGCTIPDGAVVMAIKAVTE